MVGQAGISPQEHQRGWGSKLGEGVWVQKKESKKENMQSTLNCLIALIADCNNYRRTRKKIEQKKNERGEGGRYRSWL